MGDANPTLFREEELCWSGELEVTSLLLDESSGETSVMQ